MSGQTGRSMKFAFAKFGTNSWGVAASVTQGIYFEGDAGMQLKPAMIVDNAFNQPFTGPADPGMIEAPSCPSSAGERYDDKQFIWEALAMGSPAAAAISTSASGQTTSWLHQFDLADAIDGLGLTAAIDKNLYVDELTSAKVVGFEVTQDTNGAMNQTFKVVGNKPTNISSVNINSTLAGATIRRSNPRAAAAGRVPDEPQLRRRARRHRRAEGREPQVHVRAAAGRAARVRAGLRRRTGRQRLADHHGRGDVPRMNTVSANSLYAGHCGRRSRSRRTGPSSGRSSTRRTSTRSSTSSRTCN
jgi:hypothetical protein